MSLVAAPGPRREASGNRRGPTYTRIPESSMDRDEVIDRLRCSEDDLRGVVEVWAGRVGRRATLSGDDLTCEWIPCNRII